MPDRPIIAITMGDPAGIGPEIIAKALGLREVFDFCRPFVIGDAKVMKHICRILGSSLAIRGSAEIEGIEPAFGTIDVLDLDNVDIGRLKFGIPCDLSGKPVVEYIKKGAALAMDKKIDAITTAPINKEMINVAGYNYAGHTELLARLSRTDDFGMMMVGGPIRVILVTTHIPLKDVSRAIKRERVFRTIRLAKKAMGYFGIDRPRIAVAALNPHAGEGRLFGEEDQEEVLPAVLKARGEGIDVTDPLPADTLFYKVAQGYYDVVVAMYHDQGLIPLKMMAFGRAVNLTVGLPFIRTSVDHGTAYDIAGKGIANPTSLIEALRLAAQLAGKK